MESRVVRNADNDDPLLPDVGGGLILGYVDDVNGSGAAEVPFLPTRHELGVLARYWGGVVAEIEDVWAALQSVGSEDMRVRWFALRRMHRIADLVGVENLTPFARRIVERGRAYEPRPCAVEGCTDHAVLGSPTCERHQPPRELSDEPHDDLPGDAQGNCSRDERNTRDD